MAAKLASLAEVPEQDDEGRLTQVQRIQEGKDIDPSNLPYLYRNPAV
jgi:hypothetical protein